MATFAQRITNLRQKRGLTQRNVAEALEIPLSTYKEWEYGRRIQGEEVYVRLAEIFEVSLKTLLTGQEQQTRDDILEKVQLALKQMNEVKRSLISL